MSAPGAAVPGGSAGGLAAALLAAAALVAAGPGAVRAGGPNPDPACAPPWEVRVSDSAPAQGQPVLVEVRGTPGADNVAVAWKGRRFPLRAAGDGRFVGIVGVDLLDRPGTVRFDVLVSGRGAVCRVDGRVEVREREFPVQRLTLPRRMAEFDPAAVARIKEEAARLEERLSAPAGPPSWELPLLPPVDDFRPHGYGARRIINGEPRSPHAGVDISVPGWTPVWAIADGVVVFAGEQFLGGKSVVIDHGGGLVSIYYHLAEFPVVAGERVSRGDRIGVVGATGRAAGPHLHFGIRAAGARVDPALLFRLAPH